MMQPTEPPPPGNSSVFSSSDPSLDSSSEPPTETNLAAGEIPEPEDPTENASWLHPFQDRLQAVYEVERELSCIESFDELCYQAIVLGRERLGFDRMSLWFLKQDGTGTQGSFGVDENGQIRDERDWGLQGPPEILAYPFLEYKRTLRFKQHVPLYNHRYELVGYGDLASAALWDGENVIGILHCDNLLSQAPISESMQEALMLYASTVGHLCTRRRTETALREERDFNAVVLNTVGALVVVLNRQGQIVHFNRACEQLTGYALEEVQGRPFWELFLLSEDKDPIREAFLQIGAERAPQSRENYWRTRSGEKRLLSWNNSVLYGVSGEIRYIIGTGVDITDRKRAEAALRESEQQHRTVIAALAEGVLLIDSTGEVLTCNASAERILSISAQRLPHNLRNISGWETFREDGSPFPVEEWPSTICLATGQIQNGVRMGLRRENGETLWLSLNARPIFSETTEPRAVVVSITDITADRHLQAQLVQAQKMEAIGRLAGGIAHDFNNLLTVIQGYTSLAQSEPSVSDSTIAPYLENVQKAAERAAELTGQLLAFARKQMVAPRVITPADLVHETYGMLHRLIGPQVELVLSREPQPGQIKMDPGQFQQILINLAINARDAMPDGGRLTIETASILLDSNAASQKENIPSGPYVRLRVSDTGVGIAPDLLPHIFEPFFTTKSAGKGIGLGLATCHSIVRQGGGIIQISSAPHQGSVFEILLPRVEAGLETPTQSSAAVSYTGTETILVAEDEEALRRFTVTTLLLRGYSLLEAANGEEALQVAHEFPDRIDLLITDLMMPIMGGKELDERLRLQRNEFKTLFVSGYAEDSLGHQGELDPNIHFLQKPYNASVLARKVREVLETN